MVRILVLSALLTVLVVAVAGLPVPSQQVTPSLQRSARQSVSDNTLDLGNISAPEYIKTLFTNLSNKDRQANMVPSNDDFVNAVRSFPNLLTGQCGRVGFNISIISSAEFVVKATLRVRVNKPSTSGSVLAVLKHSNSTIITQKIVAGDWIEFSVNGIIAAWAKEGSRKRHVFIIELQENGQMLKCTGQSIITSTEDRDQQPLLVVYSIEPNVEDMPIIKGIRRMINNSSRAKRSTAVSTPIKVPMTSSCTKHTIDIQVSWLNSIIIDGKIVGPTSYNGAICGGSCERTVPQYPHHAIIFHLLHNGNKITAPHRYEKCCVPVEYKSMNFVTRLDGGVYELWKMENAYVSKCDCIYYRAYQ